MENVLMFMILFCISCPPRIHCYKLHNFEIQVEIRLCPGFEKTKYIQSTLIPTDLKWMNATVMMVIQQRFSLHSNN